MEVGLYNSKVPGKLLGLFRIFMDIHILDSVETYDYDWHECFSLCWIFYYILPMWKDVLKAWPFHLLWLKEKKKIK